MNKLANKECNLKIPRIISSNCNKKHKEIKIKIKNIKIERFSSLDQFKRKLENSHLITLDKKTKIDRINTLLFSPSAKINNTLTSFKSKSHSTIPNNDQTKTFQPNSTCSDFNPMKTICSKGLYSENIDEEIKPLISYYFVNGSNQNYYKGQEGYFKGIKKEFMKKYNIYHDSKVINELVIIVNIRIIKSVEMMVSICRCK